MKRIGNDKKAQRPTGVVQNLKLSISIMIDEADIEDFIETIDNEMEHYAVDGEYKWDYE